MSDTTKPQLDQHNKAGVLTTTGTGTGTTATTTPAAVGTPTLGGVVGNNNRLPPAVAQLRPSNTSTATTTTKKLPPTPPPPKKKPRQPPFSLVGKKGHSDEDLLEQFVEYNRELAAHVKCKDLKTTWENPTYTRCQCLTILLKPPPPPPIRAGKTPDPPPPTAAAAAVITIRNGGGVGGVNNDGKATTTTNTTTTTTTAQTAATNGANNNNNDGTTTTTTATTNSNNEDTEDNANTIHPSIDPNKDLFLYAVATYQLYFGKLVKREQQLKVMDWMRYALHYSKQRSECIPKRPYFIPYMAPESYAATMPAKKNKYDNDPLDALAGHQICKASLMRILGIGRKWWMTCQESVENHRLPPVHGGVGKISGRKRRFMEEEEADLIAFLEDLKRVAEPSTTKKRPNQSDNIIYYLDPSSWSKRYCYKRYCAQRGKSVRTSADGANVLEDIDGHPGGAKQCISWGTFQKYWVTNYPRLRHRSP